MYEQILREQIVELTKLLELKDMRIKELEALRTIPTVYNPFVNHYIDKTTGLEQTIQATSNNCDCVKCGSK